VPRTALAVIVGSTTGPLVDELWGYSLYSTSAATVVFRDQTSTGSVIWGTQVTSNEYDHEFFAQSINIPSGVLYIDSTGVLVGSVVV
jgi:hypothetical protein